MQVGPNESLYTVQETAERTWSTVAASLEPIEKILAKFAQRLEQVQVGVEQLQPRSVDALETVPGTVSYAMFRVEIADIAPDDILAA